MKTIKNILLCVLLAGFCLSASGQGELKKIYREDVNPMEQIDEALSKASSENKHVICQLGGNWCIWCLRFADFIERDSTISQLIDRNYVYIHVNYNPRNQAGTVRPEQTSALLQRLGQPARFGFPVLIVLNQEGKLLHIQDSSFLEEGKGYNHDKVLRFLRCWTPEAVKAD